MNQDLKISGSIVIDASAAKVWDVLTNPEKIKMYIGSQTITDWKVGSAIAWRGEAHGRKYEDKGKVLANQQESLLKFEYWSSVGGTEDKPENYSIITYTLNKLDDSKTSFTYTRERIPSEQEYQMFEYYLQPMLEGIKALAEEK